jgi:hypothetical protein
MSRARVRDNSNPVQLFPFVAVLLCTMGSLLVILVVVARCSWDHGLQQAAVRRQADPEAAKRVDEVRQRLSAVHSYVEQLGTVRAQAEEKLRGDQLQLSHLEDHMRRLQDQLGSLRNAAGELDGLEHEHYDDRAQAEREIARLGQLIEDQKKDVEELKRNGNNKPRSYAIVPFIGRNGTRRPPIYVECRGKELILQPEGIHLTEDDFVPELGPGSPLTAALRAAREYLVGQNAVSGADPEPYPLLLVRPKGEYGFYESRALFERCGIQFGYELVDGNWDLKYPPANPELAARENQAIELARGRVKALAAAAPGMLRRDRDEDDDEGDSGDDFAGGASGGGGRYGGEGMNGDGRSGTASGELAGVGPGDVVHTAGPGLGADGQGARPGLVMGGGGAASGAPVTTSASGSITANGGQPGGAASGESQDSGLPNLLADARSGGASGGSTSDGSANNAAASSQNNPSGGLALASGAPSATSNGSGAYSSSGNGAYSSGGSSYASGGNAPTNGALPGDTAPRSPGATIIGSADGSSTAAAAVTIGRTGSRDVAAVDDDDEAHPPAPTGPGMYRERPPEHLAATPRDDKPQEKHHARGKNWALVDANSQATPIRRTIQVVVRGDRVSILPEGASAAAAAAAGREISLSGNSRETYEPFVTALETQIQDWGMAGKGLYWRPVLDINIGPDGQQRAADITRLLKNSGIELRASSAIATQNQGTINQGTNGGASSSR